MAIRIDLPQQVFSKDEFLLSSSYSFHDCVPAVAKFQCGNVYCLTTDKYQGIWERDTPNLGRLATRKERNLVFGSDRPFDGQEALVLLCKKADELILVSLSAFTPEECDKAFRQQVWRDADCVKTCTAGWAKRYRELFNHEAHVEDAWAALDAPQSTTFDGSKASEFSTTRPVEVVKKKAIDWSDLASELEENPFADPAPEFDVPQKTTRMTWEDLDAPEREFNQLVREVMPYGFTDSSQVSSYIKRHRLHNKYRHISGMVRFCRYGDEWEFPGISPDWYAKLCERLGLGSRASGAHVTGFTSFADLNG